MTHQGQISYDRECEVWRCVGRERKGHKFTAVELVGDRLIATDNRMLASIPVSIEGDVPERFAIDSKALKEARKATRVKQSAVLAFDHDSVATGGVRYSPVSGAVHEQIPPIEDAMPKGIPVAKIGIDPKRLFELAKAIGADNGIFLTVYADGNSPQRSVEVHKVDADGHLCDSPSDAFGLLFPVTPQS